MRSRRASHGSAPPLNCGVRRQTKRGRSVNKSRYAFGVTAFLSLALSAQAPDGSSDHFAPAEDVSASFKWEQHAQCTLSDAIGVLLRSNWQERHWIKIAGQQ